MTHITALNETAVCDFCEQTFHKRLLRAKTGATICWACLFHLNTLMNSTHVGQTFLRRGDTVHSMHATYTLFLPRRKKPDESEPPEPSAA